MKGKSVFYLSLVAGLLVASITYVVAQKGSDAPPQFPDEPQASGGIVTLYAMDPLLQSVCFADGREGHGFQANEVRNRCSDIDFSYNPGSLSVGVEGARLGTINRPWQSRRAC